ncbi:WD40/YVTN/BNR-like repeat-containing protein [Telluribacter humicola]|uniref:WD40/YVTN/BNR-like repeat-containing protein n=1 Tax=Telluribacter humicola TaxID=1720261 RepID=UPI001A96A027|nr:YCF48-related protein [Telluribacter humicola]
MNKHLHYAFLGALAGMLTVINSYGQDCKSTLRVEGATTFCEGDSIRLLTSAKPNTTFRWLHNGTPLPLQTDTVLSVKQAGEYKLESSIREGSWKVVQEKLTNFNLYSAAFDGEELWVTGGENVLSLYTYPATSTHVALGIKADGSVYKREETHPKAPYYKIKFAEVRSQDSRKLPFGWRLGDRVGEVTNDGGATWQPISFSGVINTGLIDFSDGYLKDPANGVLVGKLYSHKIAGSSQLVMRFQNNQAIPVEIFSNGVRGGYGNVPYEEHISGLFFANDNIGYVVSGKGGIARTTNGGLTWAVVRDRKTDSKPLNGVYFASPSVGWVVGSNGLIYKTTDAGETWEDQSVAEPYTFTQVHFVDHDRGYTIGFEGTDYMNLNGILLETANGGKSWTRVTLPEQPPFNDILFTDPDHGWIIGNNGTVLQYSASYCTSESDPVTVVVNPRPAQPTITANADMKLVSSATSGNQWYFNGTAITGATAAEYTPAQSGRYTVQTNQTGCSSAMSEAFEFVVTATDPAMTGSVIVYPNPTSDQLHVSLKDLTGAVHIELISPDGRMVGQKQVSSTNQQSVIPLELKGLAPGAYVVRVRSSAFTKTSKVILNQ